MERSMTPEEMKRSYYLETKSPAYRAAIRDCELVATAQANILVLGDSGTGKDVAARYIHACGARREGPFVAVNCSAYTDTLLESELFGHEQGAFTGAVKARVGRFEEATGGTLFMDEVGDINLATQVKLLRAIETRVIERIGSNVPRRVDFRLISATNKEPATEVRAGRMREDFFYRVSTIVIRIPSLRERREDLPELIDFFLKGAQRENGKEITGMEESVRDFLLRYDYPGNLRELKNIIDRMVVLSDHGIITRAGLPILYDLNRTQTGGDAQGGRYTDVMAWKEFKRKSESEYLAWVIEQTGGNISEAARRLGLSARQLFNKISEYGLRHT